MAGYYPTANAFTQLDFVAARYRPDELVLAMPGRRLAGHILDSLPAALLVIALVFGLGLALLSASAGLSVLMVSLVLSLLWFIWLIIAAGNGQTPGKQLLHMYILKSDGSRAGFGFVILREVIVKQFVFNFISLFVVYFFTVLGGLWCLWDTNNQCLWDKFCGTFIAYSPLGFRPLTLSEMTVRGLPMRSPGSGQLTERGTPQIVINNSNSNNQQVGSNYQQTLSKTFVGARIAVLDAGQPLPAIQAQAGQVFVIGRDSLADIRISDPKASRRHLEITCEPNGWALRDLGATNPARVLSGSQAQRVIRGATLRLPSGQVAVGDAVITLYPPGNRA